jgi:excinuclease ABC subunit C
VAQFDVEKLQTYPLSPGVYLMKSKSGAILYIGKAKNLRARLKQYFFAGGDGRWMIPYLIAEVVDIETLVTATEKEALLLENNLIKQHKPRYNALLKDDKTYAALMINHRHKWPMLSLIRYKGKPKGNSLYFGPYASTYAARETLDLMQRVFPLRQCSDQELLRRTRPCILYGMKRCTAPCVGLISKEKYDEEVDAAIRFLKGQNRTLIDELKKEMQAASDALEFERAQEILLKIQAIEKTLQTQVVDNPLKGFSGDVLGIYRQVDELVLSQLTFVQGRLTGYFHHNFSKIAENDEELFTRFILETYQEATVVPSELLVPIELEDADILQELLKIKISVPQRGDRRAYVEMAQKNAEASFKQKKDETAIREKTLSDLQEKLRLMRYPERIECYDNSHLGGKEAVSAQVTFIDGVPSKKYYRHYHLRNTDAADDYGAMREVLSRRFSKNEQELPDLLIIDGGKGHLNAARKILEELNVVSCDLIGVAKEEGRHDRGMTSEQIFLPGVKDPIHLPPHSPILFLLQRIRDEAHRFAITFQKQQRSKRSLSSQLNDIPGIGPVKQKRLLRYFGSLKRIREATLEELISVKGITAKDAQVLIDHLK